MMLDLLKEGIESLWGADLDAFVRDACRHIADGRLSEEEAESFWAAVEARRARVPRARKPALRRPPAQRSPDRMRSVRRRRRMASVAPMPTALAAHFTEGERAALAIVAAEVAAKGACALSVPEIAARAGIGQTLARRAVRTAQRLGLLEVTERRRPRRQSLTNIVRIISREWLAWIARARVHTRVGHAYRDEIQGGVDAIEAHRQGHPVDQGTGQRRGDPLGQRRAGPRPPRQGYRGNELAPETWHQAVDAGKVA